MNKLNKVVLGLLVIVLVVVIGAAIIATNQENSICNNEGLARSERGLLLSTKESMCEKNTLTVDNRGDTPIKLSIRRVEKDKNTISDTDDVKEYEIPANESNTIMTPTSDGLYMYTFGIEEDPVEEFHEFTYLFA